MCAAKEGGLAGSMLGAQGGSQCAECAESACGRRSNTASLSCAVCTHAVTHTSSPIVQCCTHAAMRRRPRHADPARPCPLYVHTVTHQLTSPRPTRPRRRPRSALDIPLFFFHGFTAGFLSFSDSYDHNCTQRTNPHPHSTLTFPANTTHHHHHHPTYTSIRASYCFTGSFLFVFRPFFTCCT